MLCCSYTHDFLKFTPPKNIFFIINNNIEEFIVKKQDFWKNIKKIKLI